MRASRGAAYRVRKALILQLGYYHRGNVLDDIRLRRGGHRFIVRRYQKFKCIGKLRELFELAHCPERPFIKRAVFSVEQEHRRHGVICKFYHRELGAARLAVGNAALEIILSRLRRHYKMTCKLFESDILRHIEKRPADARKLAEIVAENLAVRRRRKAAVWRSHPLIYRIKARARACFREIEVPRFYNSVAAAADGAYFEPVNALKALRELRIGAFELKFSAAVDIIGHEDAESRLKIMVARYIIVIAEALRAVADKTYRELIFKLREFSWSIGAPYVS